MIFKIFFTHNFSSLGGNKIPARPTTSGIEEVLETITGVPQAIASNGGKPKPSYKLGKSKAVAPEYKAGKSFSSKYPVKITLFERFNFLTNSNKSL